MNKFCLSIDCVLNIGLCMFFWNIKINKIVFLVNIFLNYFLRNNWVLRKIIFLIFYWMLSILLEIENVVELGVM